MHRLLRLPSRPEWSKSRRPLAPPPMPYPTYHAVLPSLTVLPLGPEFCPFARCRSLPRPLPRLSFEASNWLFTGCFSTVANPVYFYSPSESKLLTRESPSATICFPHPHPQRDTVLSPIPSTHLPSSDSFKPSFHSKQPCHCTAQSARSLPVSPWPVVNTDKL